MAAGDVSGGSVALTGGVTALSTRIAAMRVNQNSDYFILPSGNDGEQALIFSKEESVV